MVHFSNKSKRARNELFPKPTPNTILARSINALAQNTTLTEDVAVPHTILPGSSNELAESTGTPGDAATAPVPSTAAPLSNNNFLAEFAAYSQFLARLGPLLQLWVLMILLDRLYLMVSERWANGRQKDIK